MSKIKVKKSLAKREKTLIIIQNENLMLQEERLERKNIVEPKIVLKMIQFIAGSRIFIPRLEK